jgi:hypothetical protein
VRVNLCRHFRDFLVCCHARRAEALLCRLSIEGRGVSVLLRFVAVFTIQLKAYAALSAFLGQHPLAREERRLVAYMLAVSAVQLRYPVVFVVPVKSCDAALQPGPLR